MDSYKSSSESIIKRYKRKFNVNEVDYAELVEYMINDIRPSVSTTSWRHYRNSICTVIKSGELYDKLKSTKGLNTKKDMRLLSPKSSRDKEISPETFELIKRELLNGSKSQLKKPLYHLLVTMLNTGVRPSECFDMKLVNSSVIDGEFAVEIKRSKIKLDSDSFLKVDGNESGASVLLVRTIDLAHVDSKVIDSIRTVIELYELLAKADKEDPGYAAKFYRSLSQTMNVCVTKCLSPRNSYPTIYSARHQFASNLKASYKASGISLSKSRKMVAVLMGQGSVKTSEYNYGLTTKGDCGKTVCFPLESEFEVAQGHRDRVDD